MSGKKSRPVIEKLTGSSLFSGNRAVPTDEFPSPRSPLDFKIRSPRGLKNYDLGEVGLGIVAALEKSGGSIGEIRGRKAFHGRNLNLSDPIPVISVNNPASYRRGFEKMDMDGLEDYTYVTCHGPKRSYTRVYYDGARNGRSGQDRVGFDWKSRKPSVFNISPARSGDVTAYPISDFLSSCHLCQKNLHGKDIYMYRGETAFCSTECRFRQIVMDERKEQCSSQASATADVAKSPYAEGQIFSTGILAI